MPALETLAVISYRQPVTGPEIQEIRGVNVSGVIKTLLEKRLITTAGRKTRPGPPHPLPHVERISDAVRPFRSRRAAEPQGVSSNSRARPLRRRRHRTSEPDAEIVAESFQATPAASSSVNEGDEPAPLTPTIRRIPLT